MYYILPRRSAALQRQKGRFPRSTGVNGDDFVYFKGYCNLCIESRQGIVNDQTSEDDP